MVLKFQNQRKLESIRVNEKVTISEIAETDGKGGKKDRFDINLIHLRAIFDLHLSKRFREEHQCTQRMEAVRQEREHPAKS